MRRNPAERVTFLKLTKTQKYLFAGLFAVAALLLLLGARYDLAFSQTVYQPQSLIAGLMEAICWWPLYLPVALLGAVWAFLYRDNPGRHVLGEALLVVFFFILFAQTLGYLAKRGILPLDGLWFTGLQLVLTLVCTVAAISFTARFGKADLIRLDFIAKTGILLCAADNIAVNLIKVIWARTRFDDMAAAGDFSAFSAWYRPGGAGGTSFPSGHTAAACGIFLLLLLPVVFDALKSKATLLAGISLGFIAFSAFCRVWIGRHFLSDTAAAAIIMTAVFLLIIQNPLFAKRLAGMQQRAADAALEKETPPAGQASAT